MLRPTVGSGLVISWAGMRGIVSLAAAMALPAAFPYRDLIVLTAFSVVLGTLVIQGLTLKPLLRALDLHDDDPVGREVSAARERALACGAGDLRARSIGARGRRPSGVQGTPGGGRRDRWVRRERTLRPRRPPSRRAPGRAPDRARDARQ